MGIRGNGLEHLQSTKTALFYRFMRRVFKGTSHGEETVISPVRSLRCPSCYRGLCASVLLSLFWSQ